MIGFEKDSIMSLKTEKGSPELQPAGSLWELGKAKNRFSPAPKEGAQPN